MMSFRTLVLASAIAAAPLSTAMASTLAPLPASCFTYEFASTSPAAHEFSGRSMHASLPGTPLTLDVQGVTIRDTKGKIDARTLERFNAAAAYAALTAFHGGVTPACQGQNTTISNADIKGAAPDALWSGVRLQKQDGRDLTLTSAKIETVETVPDLHLRLSGTGIHASKQPLAPSVFTADLTIQGVDTPAQQISINALHALVDTSSIDGKGVIQPGTSASTSSAAMHIEITDIAGLTRSIQQTAPAKITTALTIARMMGHNSGNKTAWDVALQGGVVTVNNIPMPIAVR